MNKKREKKNIGKCCVACGNFIDTKLHHYIQISTYNRSHSPDDHVFFHFNCWVEYFNARVKKKAEIMVSFMQNKAIQVFDSPMIQSILQSVKGSDRLGNMLKIPLGDKVVPKKIVISKIQNDRKQKRSGKKRKAQMHKV